MILLHYAPGSSHSAAVRIVLAEKGIEHELNRIDMMHFEQHSPDFLEINRHGMVPVLEDGGRPMFESFPILSYLDDMHPDPPLAGNDPRQRYLVNKWGKYVETHIAPHLAIARWKAVKGKVPEMAAAGFANLLPERRALWERAAEGFGTEQLEASTLALVGAGERLAVDLGNNDWVAGESITLADIALFPHLHQFVTLGIPIPAKVEAWLGRMGERASVKSIKDDIWPLAVMGPELGRWG